MAGVIWVAIFAILCKLWNHVRMALGASGMGRLINVKVCMLCPVVLDYEKLPAQSSQANFAHSCTLENFFALPRMQSE